MKYFLACLIIPIVVLVLAVTFGFGALYQCVAKLFEQMRPLTGYVRRDIEGGKVLLLPSGRRRT